MVLNIFDRGTSAAASTRLFFKRDCDSNRQRSFSGMSLFQLRHHLQEKKLLQRQLHHASVVFAMIDVITPASFVDLESPKFKISSILVIYDNLFVALSNGSIYIFDLNASYGNVLQDLETPNDTQHTINPDASYTFSEHYLPGDDSAENANNTNNSNGGGNDDDELIRQVTL